MKSKDLLAHLEQSCRDRGIRLIYDDLQTEGGFCRAHDSYYVIINRRAAAETRVRLLSEALEKIPRQLPAELVTEGAAAAIAPAQSRQAESDPPDAWSQPAY